MSTIPVLIPTDTDLAHERCVLASMIHSAATAADVIEFLRVDDFYMAHHQECFKAITTVWDRCSDMTKPLDVGLVYEEMSRNCVDQTPEAKQATLQFLGDILTEEPTGVNAMSRAELVRQHSLRRQLVHMGQSIMSEAFSSSCDPERLVGSIQRRSFEIGSEKMASKTISMREIVTEVKEMINNRMLHKGKEVTGVPSGLIDLDKLTSGFQNCELCLVAARPSVGKTALAVGVAVNAANNGVPTLFFSMEQSRLELASRMIVKQGGVSSSTLRSGRIDDNQLLRVVQACDQLGPIPLWINDASSQKVRNIFAISRRLKAKEKIGMVVIDYLQFIEPDDYRVPRHEQVAAISRSLKRLARDLEVPVVCLAQLNRNADESVNTRPRLRDLKESGALEQDSDTVILLHRVNGQKFDDPMEHIEAIVAKQRNGATGVVNLWYRKAHMKFENYAPI